MEQEAPIAPPYVSYKTFKDGIRSLIDEEGRFVPRVDPSVISKMSGSTQTLFLNALRQFNLISKDGTPTDELKALAAKDDAGWKHSMRALVKQRYLPQLELLDTGTPNQLSESFDKWGPQVREKAIRFLIAAAQEGGLKVSARIANGRYSSGSTPRKPKPKSGEVGGESATVNPPDPSQLEFPLYFKGKKQGRIVVPDSFDRHDLLLVQSMVAMLEAVAAQNEESGD